MHIMLAVYKSHKKVWNQLDKTFLEKHNFQFDLSDIGMTLKVDQGHQNSFLFLSQYLGENLKDLATIMVWGFF